jgi:Family of unknown function (DUF6067)
MHLLRAQGNNPAHSRDIRVIGDTIIFHGTRLELDQQGFPGQIDSMLAENIHFHFTRQADGKDIRLKSEGIVFIRQQPARVEWRAINISDELKMELNAVLISDGLLSYTVKATALQDLELKEITMHIPVRPDSNYAWKKDTARANQTEVSVSTGHAGLHYLLHGSAWMNEGKGSTTVGIKGRSLLANNYSGAHNMKKGDTIEYDFDLYLLREANH